jgi:hypothetical protein
MTFRTGGLALAVGVWGAAAGCSGKDGDDSVSGDESDADTDTDTDTDTDSDTDSDTDTDTPGKSNATLVINEILAQNNTTNVDEAGQYEDWMELYNTGSAAIDLEGFQLTDDPEGGVTPWAIPAGNSIDPGGWFLIWCDDDGGDGPLHADFQLQADGEDVALYDPKGAIVDEVSYDSQTPDVSWARQPDGGDTWQATTPTPLAANP